MTQETANRTDQSSSYGSQSDVSAKEMLHECLNEYTRERPEVVVMWAFGIGFILGWKLKPW